MNQNDMNLDGSPRQVLRPKPVKKLVRTNAANRWKSDSSGKYDGYSAKAGVISKKSVRGKYDSKSKLTYKRESSEFPVQWKDYHAKHNSGKKKKSEEPYIGKHENLTPEREQALKAAIGRRTLVRTDKVREQAEKARVIQEKLRTTDPEVIYAQREVRERQRAIETIISDNLDFPEPEIFSFNIKRKPKNDSKSEDKSKPEKSEATVQTSAETVQDKAADVQKTQEFIIPDAESAVKEAPQSEPVRQETVKTEVPKAKTVNQAKAIQKKLSDDDRFEPYEEEHEKFVYRRQKKNPFKEILKKAAVIAGCIIAVSALVLYTPVLKDDDAGKRVSIMYKFKHWQPLVDNEGRLEENTMDLKLDDNILPDFSDGLDLPQLIEGQYSVLFLGFDEDVFNTDVMWVVQFDIGHAKLNILQIPRDSCVPDYTTSYTAKMNSVYSMGDPYVLPPIQRVVNAVQDNFGIPIDAYVTTACFDIVDMVDLIGGIDIHIDNEIIYEADKIIPAGDITLTGQQAEWFIRFRREWLTGDIGRMQNQRRFMAAAMQKLLNIVKDEGRLKLYSYLKQIYDNEYIYTDLSLDNISRLADFASTLTMENVQVNMVPGEDAKYQAPDGVYYDVYSIHKLETIDMLNNYFRPYQADMTELDSAITELVEYHQYSVYDDTGTTLEELEEATEPPRDPNKKPEWKE